MRRTLKKYFIPHAENNYHPHILHTKRALFYSAVFLLCKVIVVAFVIALPAEVFMSPEILAGESQKVMALTNELRQQKNEIVLKNNSKLIASANAKADDMITNNYFSHTSPTGATVADFIRASGYRYRVAGENLAIGFATAEAAMEAWKKSPTHYANLVDKDYIDLGVSVEVGDFNGEPLIYMVQHFAAPVKTAVVTPPAPEKVTPKVPSAPVAPAEKPVEIPVTTPETVATTTVVLSEKAAVIPPASLELPLRQQSEASQRSEAPTEAVVGRPFWDNPVEKYMRAKEVPPAFDMFGVSRGVFMLAGIFFALALALGIFIEIKKQHPHIIVQTAGLLGLLAVLLIL